MHAVLARSNADKFHYNEILNQGCFNGNFLWEIDLHSTCAERWLHASDDCFMGALQLTFLIQIYKWLEGEIERQSDSILATSLDLEHVALAGHSRGGKLAALQYANGKSGSSCAFQTFLCKQMPP